MSGKGHQNKGTEGQVRCEMREISKKIKYFQDQRTENRGALPANLATITAYPGSLPLSGQAYGTMTTTGCGYTGQ